MKLINLKQFRKERGLSQVDMSRALSLPQSSISYLENGLQEVTDDLIDRIKKAYKVDDLSDFIYERATFHDPEHVNLSYKEKMESVFTGDWCSPTPIDIIEGFLIICKEGKISVSTDGTLIIDRNNGIGFRLSHYIIRPEQFENPYLILDLTTKPWFDEEMFENFKRAYFIGCKIADIYPMKQFTTRQ